MQSGHSSHQIREEAVHLNREMMENFGFEYDESISKIHPKEEFETECKL